MRIDRLNRAWGLVALSVLVNTCLGTIYSWSVFRAPLGIRLSLESSQLGVPYSIFLAAFAFSMPVGGLLIPRLGPRRLLAFGGILVGAGWVAAGQAGSILGLSLAYGLLGGIGVGLSYGVPLAVVASWFPARRGLAMGIALAGFGMSPFVTAPLANMLITHFGVSAAMSILGVAFTVIVASLAPIFAPAPGSGLAGGGTAHIAATDVGPAGMVRTRHFYTLWGCFAVGTLAGLTAIGMTASYAEEVVGLPASRSAAAVAAFGLLNGAGRPLFGALHDRLGSRLAMVVAFAIVSLAAVIGMVAGPGSSLPFYAAFALFWTMLGGWLAIAPAATTALFGASTYARNYGIVYTAYGVGALGGGTVSGLLLARFGTYRPLFVVIVLLCAAGAAAAWAGLRGPVRIGVARSQVS